VSTSGRGTGHAGDRLRDLHPALPGRLDRGASFPPIETTRWVESAGMPRTCSVSDRVIAPSTASSVARAPVGTRAPQVRHDVWLPSRV
jgi:hypothetical protein